MLNKDLVGGNIGAVGKYDVAIADGMFAITASASDFGVNASLSISVSGKAIIDALAAKVGGPIPAEVAAFLESAIGLA